MKKDDLIKRFRETDISNFPDFFIYEKPLEQGLWILWVTKEKLGIKKLSAEEIAEVIRDVMEISVSGRSLNNSFTGSGKGKGKKVHIHHGDKEVSFEIMQPGKEHLLSKIKAETVNVFYFEPGKRFTSKKILSEKILENLGGEIKIVDPYCSERTLDILTRIKGSNIQFLTQIEKLIAKDRNKFLRELKDFNLEHKNVEFKDYPHSELHDRYIISNKSLIILGHSIKNLGEKESFAVILNKEENDSIYQAVLSNFDSRWKNSNNLS